MEGIIMEWILYVISILWLSVGVCLILYTEETRGVLQPLLRQADPRLVAALPALFGLLFFVAAGASHYPWFVRLLGILALGKAAFFFLDPKGLRRQVNDWFLDKMSQRACRLWGIVTVILATALFSWIR
jgi:phosphoglycerol transferase MdoB-like AlkP superfamily enzyme